MPADACDTYVVQNLALNIMTDRPNFMWEPLHQESGTSSTTLPSQSVGMVGNGPPDVSTAYHNGTRGIPYGNNTLPYGDGMLSGHMSSHNGGLPSQLIVPHPIKPPLKRSHQCKMCDQMFETKSDMLLHCQQVHKQDPKPYKCPQCQKCFANSSYLSQHNRIHAGIKPYRCEICERKFTQLSHLQQHLRTHTGEKPYKCRHSGCEKAFSQLANLQQHSRSHMTDKPYRCNSCYKCFTSEQGLREHIPKHNETKHLKTHICTTCGKSYTQETYLERHMMKHNSSRRPNQIEHRRTSSQSSDLMSENSDVKEEGDRNYAYGCNEDLIRNKLSRDGRDSHYPYIPRDDADKCGILIPTCKSSAFNPFTSGLGPSSLQQASLFASTLPSSSDGALTSPSLPHMSSVNPSRYFPYDQPVNRNPSRDSMIANSLLSLQHIQNYTKMSMGHGNMQ